MSKKSNIHKKKQVIDAANENDEVRLSEETIAKLNPHYLTDDDLRRNAKIKLMFLLPMLIVCILVLFDLFKSDSAPWNQKSYKERCLWGNKIRDAVVVLSQRRHQYNYVYCGNESRSELDKGMTEEQLKEWCEKEFADLKELYERIETTKELFRKEYKREYWECYDDVK
ncbi:MAG: hypothetical protein FWF51_08955 [Chitinivibrionia bacterium]|nr:hypothetical protein [Chitinivibrionia bacterium]